MCTSAQAILSGLMVTQGGHTAFKNIQQLKTLKGLSSLDFLSEANLYEHKLGPS
jgi:hypothetical protein